MVQGVKGPRPDGQTNLLVLKPVYSVSWMDLRRCGYLGGKRFNLKEQQEVPAAACLCDRRERDSTHRWASGISSLYFVLSPLHWQSLACPSAGDSPASNPELCS